MNQRLAIICPGQGGQHEEMFALADADPHLRQLLASWIPHAKLEAPIDEILGDKNLLFSNRAAQPLVVMAALIAWEGLRDTVPAPALVSGYSIGELSSYAIAGSLDCQDAIELAASRASLMDDCVRKSPRQTMISVGGLDRRTVQGLMPENMLFVAIETGENSFIVGGLASAASAFMGRISELGGYANELPVAVASHTLLMKEAAAAFRDELQRHLFRDPVCPVLSGISAEPIRDAGKARTALCSQIEQEIMWADCMDVCAESGITIALELGPGTSMSRMLRARHPAISCRSVADFRSLGGIRNWINSHFD